MKRLQWASLGRRGDRYPVDLRALDASSGCYILRSVATREVLYVGESHDGRLYQTITRHLQQWRRAKRFWVEQYGRPHDPGVTYARASVSLVVLVLPAAQAYEAQARLIRTLKPRDNILEQLPEVDALPF